MRPLFWAARTRVDQLLAAGWTGNAIEAEMRRSGTPIKQETVRRHLRECLANDPLTIVELEALGRRMGEKTIGTDAEFRRDLARIVRAKAIRGLQRGALGVTTRDGLAAKRLLYRRIEGQQDQAFQRNLARLLSGAGESPPASLSAMTARSISRNNLGLRTPISEQRRGGRRA